MCPRSLRVIRFWPISTPISSRNFSPNTRSIRGKPPPDAFWLLPYTWRSRPQRRLAQFSELVCAKGGCTWNSGRDFSWRLFCYRQLDMGFRRRNELALSAVAGNSHSNPRAPAPQGKTASTEKSAIFGHIPSASEITREIEEEGFVHVDDAGWDWEDY